MLLSSAPAKLVLPFAATGSKNTIPAASQIGIVDGAASLTDGFPPLTRTPKSAGGKPVDGLDMNGILYELSNVARWANAGGGYVYDAAFATDSNVAGYPKGAVLLKSGGNGWWLNTVDSNTTNPDAAGAGWVDVDLRNVATAAGTADAITAAFSPAVPALVHGMSLRVRAASANATATPTFTPNSGVIAAATIVKGNNIPLAASDIAGAGHWLELAFDSTLTKWVLLNPATGVTVQNFHKNTVLNGDGRVRQGINATISASRQYGLADGWLMSVSSGTPSAGTITADNITLGVNKSQVKVAGLTCTGSGVVDFVTRIAGEDAVRYSGKTVMVSALVQHDVGSNINWTIALRKANTLDTFSAVTGVSASGAFSVPTATGTRIFVPATLAASDGDNGLEILIQATCGAVTTKNFFVTECQIEVGGNITEYDNTLYQQVLANCQRQYWRSQVNNYAAGYTGVSNQSLVAFQGPSMRGTPALLYSALSEFSLQSGVTSGVISSMTVASINNGMYSLQVTTSTAITTGNVAFLRNVIGQAPWIAFDSRL